MSHVRRILRCFLLSIWLVFMGMVSLPFRFGGWGSIRRVCSCTRLWGAGIARLIGMRIRVSGDISSFKGGLIVSNHQGYLDIIAHAAVFPIRFSPKSDIRNWPFMGWYLGISRPVWVDRGSKQKSAGLKREFVETMRHDIPLIIYPEGTSSDGKNGILPFKSTPFAAVADTELPILPVVTVFADPPEGGELAWYGPGSDATLLPHVFRILGYRRIDVELRILPVVYPEGRGRKELAEYVHGIMEREYRRVMEERVA